MRPRLAILAVLVLAAFLAHPLEARADSYQWTGNGDHTSFDDPQNWSPESVPDSDDDVSVKRLSSGPATLTVGNDTHLGKLTQGEGSYVIGGSLTLSKGYDWSGGELDTDLTLGEKAVSRFSGADEKRLMGGAKGRFGNAGVITIGGEATIRVWDVQIVNTGGIVLEHGAEIHGLRCCSPVSAAIHNSGRVAVIPGPLSLLTQTATLAAIGFENAGAVDAVTGTLDLIAASHRFRAGSAFNGFGRVRLSEGEGTVDAYAEMDGRVAISGSTTLVLADGGHLTGQGSFSGGTIEWTGGAIDGDVKTSDTTSLRITGASERILRRDAGVGSLVTEGATTYDATGALTFAGDAVFHNRGTMRVTGPTTAGAQGCCLTPARFENTGTLVIDPGGQATAGFAALAFANAGTVRVASGTLETTLLPYVQTDGTTELAGGTLSAPAHVELRGGALRGTGTVKGDLENGALVAPGERIGALQVTGDYAQLASGRLGIDIAGTAPRQGHDQLAVAGAASIAGRLELDTSGVSSSGVDRFAVVTAGTRTGEFSSVTGGTLPDGRRLTVEYPRTGVTVRIGAAPPIIFIHGTLGSRMSCGSREIWPTIAADVDQLQLEPDGVTNRPGACSGIAAPTAILERFAGSPIYGPTIDFLKDAAAHRYLVYVWDWRKSPELAVRGLDAMIDRARANSGADKVVLMAHSMGGLVTRWYVEDPARAAKVARAITIGTPYWGSPKALFPLAAGVESPVPSVLDALLFKNRAMQRLARNLLGLYFLWPSQAYGPWLRVRAPGESASVLDREGLLRFVDDPLRGNRELLARALDEHATHLDRFDPHGVDYHVVAGTGINTLTRVTVEPLIGGRATYGLKWGNGDGTVPEWSATLGHSIPAQRVHYACGVDHVPLPGDRAVTDRIKDFLLTGAPISGTDPPCPNRGAAIRIFRGALGPSAARASLRSGAKRPVSIEAAERQGMVDVLRLGDDLIVATDARRPVRLAVRSTRVALEITQIASRGRSRTRSYGPARGPIVVRAGSARPRVTRGGRPLGARSADRRAPRTRARVRLKGRLAVVRFTVRDASGVATTYLQVGHGPSRRVRERAVISRRQLRRARFQSVDVFGNAERPRRLRRG